MANSPLQTVAEAIAIAVTTSVPRTVSYREAVAATALAVLRTVAEDRTLADSVADALAGPDSDALDSR